MRALVTVLGNFCSWRKAKYEVEGKVVSTPFPAEALDNAFNYDKILIIVPESLAVQRRCEACPNIRPLGKVTPGNLRKKLLEFVERWLSACTRLDLEKVELKAVRAFGTFGRSEYSGSSLEAFFEDVGKALKGLVPAEEVHADLTHGLNYAVIALHEGAQLLARLSAERLGRASLREFVSEPYSNKATLKVVELNRVTFSSTKSYAKVKPEGPLGRLFEAMYS